MGYEKYGYSKSDGIYYSIRQPVPTPRNVDFATYSIFQQRNWENIALVDVVSGARVTYLELKTRVQAVASGLAQKGVKQGDVVMICMPNSIHWPVLFFGVLHLGAVVTTANPVNTISEISRQANDSNPAYIITVPELCQKLASLNIPLVLNDIDGLGIRKPIDGAPLALLSELLKADPKKVPRVRIKEDDTAVVLYSSGTTGASKGVILTHLNCVESVNQRIGNVVPGVPDEIRVSGLIIPLFHVMGLLAILCVMLRAGDQLVVFPKFDLSLMLGAIQRYRITHMALVPPILVLLAKSPLVEKYDLSSLKVIGSGAASAGNVNNVVKRIKGQSVAFIEGYGMTETAGSGTGVQLEDSEFASKHKSCGNLLANMQAMVVDVSTGKALPPNHEGELWLRGLNVMAGYLNNEKETAETLDKDGWLHTGDLVRIDENGFVYIVGRLKELIKYKGFQVAPAELESLLLSHPEIMDAAVIPCPDEEAGEIPVAFIVKRQGSSLTEVNVMQFVADQVSPYKKIRRVMFINSIPKSESGKILRIDLKKLLVPSTSKL